MFVMAFNRDWAPTSSGRGPGGTGKALPPLWATERRSDGRRIGSCRNGHLEFWDNRPAKRAAQASSRAPDFVCVTCREGIWESDAFVRPIAKGSKRALRGAGTSSPEVRPVGNSVDRPNILCSALTKKGPCKNRPKKGFAMCGPHLDRSNC